MSSMSNRNIYMRFGYNFAGLTIDQLEPICDDEGISYYNSDKKYDLVYKLEKHFALKRERNETANRDFLEKDFSPFSYSTAELRQVLTEHDVPYHTLKANLSDLAEIFAEHIVDIREMYFPEEYQTSGPQPTNDLDSMFANMNVNQTTPAYRTTPAQTGFGPRNTRSQVAGPSAMRARFAGQQPQRNNTPTQTQQPQRNNNQMQTQQPQRNNNQTQAQRNTPQAQAQPLNGQFADSKARATTSKSKDTSDGGLSDRFLEGRLEQCMAKAVQQIQSHNALAALSLVKDLVTDFETVLGFDNDDDDL